MLSRNIQGLRDNWEEIFEDSSDRSIFQSYEYVDLWYKCFSQGRLPHVVTVSKNGFLLGILPMILESDMGIRTLSSLNNGHSLHCSLLCRAGHENEFFEEAFRHLLVDMKGWDVLDLQFMYSFQILTPTLRNYLLEKFNGHFHTLGQPSYCISLIKSYENYYKRDLSKHFQQNISYYKKRLSKGGEVCFYHYCNEEAIKYWESFLQIEDSGWKGVKGSSIKRLGKDFIRYYSGLINLLSKNNQLHIYFLSINNENIAAVFGYEDGDTFHYWKTGYDEKYKKFSPSHLLLLHIVEDLINNRPDIKRLHMFQWDHGYKHRFANEDAQCFETLIYNRNMRGRFSKWAAQSKAMVKNILTRRYRTEN